MPCQSWDSCVPFRYTKKAFFTRIAVELAVVMAIISALIAGDANTTATAQDNRQTLLIEGNKKLAARANYRSYCADCHGPNGDGRRAGGGTVLTVDFTTPKAVAQLDRDRMILAVSSGHDNSVRSKWAGTLDEGSTAAIVDYIREAFMLPAPVADASIGRRIYARTCSVCHGERGDAASWARNSLYPPPLNFGSADAKKLTRQKMINAVTFGVQGTAMMPFATQLTAREIPAVVDYIRETFVYRESPEEAAKAPGSHGTETIPGAQHHASRQSAHREHGHGDAPPDMKAGFPDALVGDATRGKALYEQNCVACHGKNGDGQGPRAYFMTRKPADFMSARARAELNRPHLFQAISMGVKRTEMPAWSKVLNAQQIADAAEYVFGAFVNPGHAQPRHDHSKPHSHHEDAAPAKTEKKKH